MELEKPTALDMVKSISKTAADQSVHMAKTRSLGLASLEEHAKRISICKACSNFIPGNHPRCGKCRCFLTSKVKLAVSQCQIGKWHRELNQ